MKKEASLEVPRLFLLLVNKKRNSDLMWIIVPALVMTTFKTEFILMGIYPMRNFIICVDITKYPSSMGANEIMFNVE
jgi:hypothetical protein